jgi:hypothetical protein
MLGGIHHHEFMTQVTDRSQQYGIIRVLDIVLRHRSIILASQMLIHMLPTRVVHHNSFLLTRQSSVQGSPIYFGTLNCTGLNSPLTNPIISLR